MNQQLGWRRVVVGVHGSAASLAALRWAVREASLSGLRLQVVRAWEDEAKRLAPYAPRSGTLARTVRRASAATRVREAVRATLGPLPPVTMTMVVAEGVPARVLLGYAAGAELLVLGTGASSTTAGIGPVTRACLWHAPCPVAVVRAATTGIPCQPGPKRPASAGLPSRSRLPRDKASRRVAHR